MNREHILNEDWQVVLSLFPQNWKAMAKETGAMVRKFRNFKTEEDLMRTLLLHIARGYSLRETVVRAKKSNVSSVSDVALLKRLKLAKNWFKFLCVSLLQEAGITTGLNINGFNMRLFDGTTVKEPGQTGSLWRIHYSMNLPNLECDYFKITKTKGEGTGESFKQFPIAKNDCIIADRAYSTGPGVKYVHDNGGYILVRLHTTSLSLYSNTKNDFHLLTKLKKLKNEVHTGEWKVFVKSENGGFINGRICAVRKNKLSIQKAIQKIKKEARKKNVKTKPETLEYAKYIIIFTTLPSKNFATVSILNWYRLRWQIELMFKRLKSLAGLGHLPKYDDDSAKSWLYGKLFVGLLTEKLIRYAKALSPWGYNLEE